MSPTESAAKGEAAARWRASAAYADMIHALGAEGWADYETANAERRTDPARWQRFQLAWEERMQARCGIAARAPRLAPPREPETPEARRGRYERERVTHRARQGVSTRGTAHSSARRRPGAA